MYLNVAELAGSVGEQKDGYWVLHAERKIEDRSGKSQIYTDDVLIKGDAPKYKKVPFGIQLLKWSGHTLRAILFDNDRFPLMSRYESQLSIKDADREGSVVAFEGRLRTNTYNNGESQMLELVADKAEVKHAAENPFQALQDEWDSSDAKKDFGSMDVDDSLTADPIA